VVYPGSSRSAAPRSLTPILSGAGVGVTVLGGREELGTVFPAPAGHRAAHVRDAPFLARTIRTWFSPGPYPTSGTKPMSRSSKHLMYPACACYCIALCALTGRKGMQYNAVVQYSDGVQSCTQLG